jgi:ribose transport system substrate-binding protein
MPKNSVVLALITDDNDYQREQSAAAQRVAQKLGVNLQIIQADNDAISQSQQLLNIVQTPSARPGAIICEPVGTGMPQVARAAAAAGIAWVILNRDVDYLTELQTKFKVPVFGISSDHEEVGRIQGRQFAALLPHGGHMLYIEGPTASDAAKLRTVGMRSKKPANIEVRTIKGRWTENSGYEALQAWLRLSTSRNENIGIIGSQNDEMALGARRALQEHAQELDAAKWMRIPFTGCDGLPKTGQDWVRDGRLAATVIIPPNADIALEMVAKALQTGVNPPQRTLTKPVPYPAIEDLAKAATTTR